MTTTTVFPGTADTSMTARHATYATMQSGVIDDIRASNSVNWQVGQFYTGSDYRGYEAFFAFDTSAVGSDTISTVVASFVSHTDASTTDFVCEVFAFDWGASVDNADWRTPVQLSALTLLASLNSSAVTGGRDNFTSTGAFPAAINGAGTTSLMMASENLRNSAVPTTTEYVYWYSSDETGTTNDPQLVITHTAGVSFTGLTRPQQSVYRM